MPIKDRRVCMIHQVAGRCLLRARVYDHPSGREITVMGGLVYDPTGGSKIPANTNVFNSC